MRQQSVEVEVGPNPAGYDLDNHDHRIDERGDAYPYWAYEPWRALSAFQELAEAHPLQVRFQGVLTRSNYSILELK